MSPAHRPSICASTPTGSFSTIDSANCSRRRLHAGILCTIDIANDPVAVYRAMVAERPPRIDLLLPHATWDSPPPRPDGLARPSAASDSAYAAWLTEIYDAWNADGRPFGIRLFDSIHSPLHGGPPLNWLPRGDQGRSGEYRSRPAVRPLRSRFGHDLLRRCCRQRQNAC